MKDYRLYCNPDDDDVDWEEVWYDAADEIGMFDDDDEEGK